MCVEGLKHGGEELGEHGKPRERGQRLGDDVDHASFSGDAVTWVFTSIVTRRPVDLL